MSVCGHVVKTANFEWVCIRPDHDWPSDSGPRVAQHRRRRGNPAKPDRHVYVNRADA
jgi:hypothetical protein